MADILSEIVLPEDLRKYEKLYHEQLSQNLMSSQVQFEYAWCLVRSKYAADIQKGLVLLEDLYKHDELRRRDYLYYLALGNARLKEYLKALEYLRLFLKLEPGNEQVLLLQQLITKKMKDDLVSTLVSAGMFIGIGIFVVVGVFVVNRINKKTQ